MARPTQQKAASPCAMHNSRGGFCG